MVAIVVYSVISFMCVMGAVYGVWGKKPPPEAPRPQGQRTDLSPTARLAVDRDPDLYKKFGIDRRTGNRITPADSSGGPS